MTEYTENAHLSRRSVLGAGTSLALWSLLPKPLSAAGARDPRLLVVVLRGALDGLALAAPTGDPAYASLRGPQSLLASGDGAGLPLDGFFVLNPAMPFLHDIYTRREAIIAHAVATPYRERSHFDGQDVLESGLPSVGRSDSGWLNRALADMSSSGMSLTKASPKGLAMGAVVPLVIRGSAPTLSWIPDRKSTRLNSSHIPLSRMPSSA